MDIFAEGKSTDRADRRDRSPPTSGGVQEDAGGDGADNDGFCDEDGGVDGGGDGVQGHEDVDVCCYVDGELVYGLVDAAFFKGADEIADDIS